MFSKKKKNIVKQFIIGFGFLNGLWIAIGIDPGDELFKIITPLISDIHPVVKTILMILPIIFTLLTFLTIFLMYKKGGWVGSLAVLMAFIAGVLVSYSILVSLILLIIAYIVGIFSFKN